MKSTSHAAARPRPAKALIILFALFVAGTFALDVLRATTGADDSVAALKAASAQARTQPNTRGELPLSTISFRTRDGDSRSLADLPRSPMLLNVWATWCPPCREELPALDRLQQVFAAEDFKVVALSVDDGGLQAVEQFYRQIGVQALEVYASGREALLPLNVTALPTTLLIDARGRERWRISGSLPWDREDVVALLRSELRQ